jgi:hypothetical protein
MLDGEEDTWGFQDLDCGQPVEKEVERAKNDGVAAATAPSSLDSLAHSPLLLLLQNTAPHPSLALQQVAVFPSLYLFLLMFPFSGLEHLQGPPSFGSFFSVFLSDYLSA